MFTGALLLWVVCFGAYGVHAAPGYVSRQAITLPAISTHGQLVGLPDGGLRTVTQQHDVTVIVTVTNTHAADAATTSVLTTTIMPTFTMPPPSETTLQGGETATATWTTATPTTVSTDSQGCTVINNYCCDNCRCGTPAPTPAPTNAAAGGEGGDGYDPGWVYTSTATKSLKTRFVTNTRTVFAGPTITVSQAATLPSGLSVASAPPEPISFVVNVPDAQPDFTFKCDGKSFTYMAEEKDIRDAVTTCALADVSSAAEMTCVSNKVHDHQIQYDNTTSFTWVSAWEGASSDYLALMPAAAPAPGSLNVVDDALRPRLCQGFVAGAKTGEAAPTRVTTTITSIAMPTGGMTAAGDAPLSNLQIVVEEPQKSWLRRWIW